MLLFFSSLYVYVVYSINLCLSFFPTRRSSDLIFSFIWGVILINSILSYPSRGPYGKSYYRGNCTGYIIRDLLLYYKPKKDRKSTRLNSSHVAISYAVFCLKQKKDIEYNQWCVM